MSSLQVVGQRTLQTVELLTRAEAKKIINTADGRFGYHPYMNPASRRTGAQEFERLLPDLKNGRVARACAELVRTWSAASGASYSVSEQILLKHNIGLFSGGFRASYLMGAFFQLKGRFGLIFSRFWFFFGSALQPAPPCQGPPQPIKCRCDLHDFPSTSEE